MKHFDISTPWQFHPMCMWGLWKKKNPQLWKNTQLLGNALSASLMCTWHEWTAPEFIVIFFIFWVLSQHGWINKSDDHCNPRPRRHATLPAGCQAHMPAIIRYCKFGFLWCDIKGRLREVRIARGGAGAHGPRADLRNGGARGEQSSKRPPPACWLQQASASPVVPLGRAAPPTPLSRGPWLPSQVCGNRGRPCLCSW